MEEIRAKLAGIIEKLFAVKAEVKVVAAPENTAADYATNVAMQLAKVVHKNPMVIAEMIQAEFEKEGGEYTVAVAAPGFLNFVVDERAIMTQALNYAENLAGEVTDESYAGKTVVAEFSDPNPFKVLHVGHLYTSVVGDSISRLIEQAGGKVVRANFGGDVGLHVAKTIYALQKKEGKEDFSYFLSKLTIEDIAKCYVEGTGAYEEDEQAKAEITRLNKEIYRINAEDEHESELAQMYWRGRELSYEYFEDFYAQIGVKFDKYYPESAVADKGVEEVKAHAGTTYEESDGAIVYKGEKVGLHTRVFINREGVPTYETKDVGLIFTKWEDWKFDESVVVTGNEQTDYMRVVLASVAEYAPQLVERTTHLTHGLVKLPGNVKMSSRKGNFLKAVDVLQMIEGMVHHEKVLALAAIKYAFLKYKMGGDIVFDPMESVSTTGNSGIYLLYSAVRAKKILQKCKEGGAIAEDGGGRELGEAEGREQEKVLAKKIVQYAEVLKEAVREKAPYKICTYLYELAQEFSRFYENVKVAGNAREAELARLVQAYLNVMEHGLGLLGIEVPEEM